MIVIKSEREIKLMEEAGQVLAKVFEEIEPLVVPGVSTQQLNDKCEQIIRGEGAIPTELGYQGYPAAICASVNEVILHGIPSPKKILRDGDIVSLDMCATKNGYVADACRSFPVGICGERQLRLLRIAKECFDAAVSLLRPGVHLGDICHAIGATAAKYGCSVPREFTGHGIGTSMHEDPYIPCFGTPGTGPILREGMTLAIEPMIFEGKNAIRILNDGWTVVAKDGKLTAHYENTVAITKDGYRILTMKKEVNV